ncbi:hypothetical protein [Nocardia sp. NBC_01329]|uniref:hypothetical protein n=1 Tax=Nocardia sp. NBC_01329 TaxID=2903594 RepID=UPI002E145972|nr:hypothetical protein OG405_15440 [Nocardia sp. NBC_01329]
MPVGDRYEQLARGRNRPFTDDKRSCSRPPTSRIAPGCGHLLDSQELTEDDLHTYRNGPASADTQLAGRCRQFI